MNLHMYEFPTQARIYQVNYFRSSICRGSGHCYQAQHGKASSEVQDNTTMKFQEMVSVYLIDALLLG